jgi:hypothetical protein
MTPRRKEARTVSDPYRLIIPLESQSAEAVSAALGAAVELARRGSKPVTDVVLLTHSKMQITQTTLATVLGNHAKALAKGERIDLGGGVLLRNETMQTLKYSSSRTVLVVYYAEDKILEFVDGLSGVEAVIAVPEFPTSGELWKKRWSPNVLGEAARPAVAELITDPVVETALKGHARLSNQGHNVLHPCDKEYADETFRILRAKGHTLDPAEIKSWAIRNGWKPGAAAEIANVAAKINRLKAKPNLAKIHEPNARYGRWMMGED